MLSRFNCNHRHVFRKWIRRRSVLEEEVAKEVQKSERLEGRTGMADGWEDEPTKKVRKGEEERIQN